MFFLFFFRFLFGDARYPTAVSASSGLLDGIVKSDSSYFSCNTLPFTNYFKVGKCRREEVSLP